MDVYEAATTRRSIRKFKDAAVPYEILEKCVNAARLAPSARNRQPCEYLIVDDEKLLPGVFDCIHSWGGQPKPKGTAPPGNEPKAYLVILINKPPQAETGRDRAPTAFYDLGIIARYDAGMAAENIMLVALEEGIGTCPISALQERDLRQLLKVPDNYEIAMVLAMGYPDEKVAAATGTTNERPWTDSQGVRHVPKKKLEDVLHRNTF